MRSDEAEVMTDGEEEEGEDEDDRDDGEKAERSGEEESEAAVRAAAEEEEEGRGLLMDRSTGSVCVWKCKSWWASRSSGGSALTLLRKKGTPSMAE